MADDPQDPKKPAGAIMPSGSTVGTAVGGMAATILILVLDKVGVNVDPVSAASIGAGMAALGGWFFPGGRQRDLE